MMIKHTLTAALSSLILLFGAQTALAVIPPSLNYQGYLSDENGIPIDGAVNMTFRLYDVVVGGTALWTSTLPVTVQRGVVSVELGATVPFPPGLFEHPLWLGLEVAGDGEMTPRRPLTSAGYAFKAQDANTLEGSTASALDQSAHVTDTANPHAVTPSQIGAADATILSAHIGNTSNPHNVTAAQTGAASSDDFAMHASNPVAHHLRYSDAEAVNAMGAKIDTNPLHHDRYTDADAVTALLSNDGAGSTLDADKVDGLEASELIDAAQDEVRTPISSLPYTISQSGSYYLVASLDGSAGGIDITADDVTLDLMGFTIDGGGSVNDYGIYVSQRNNITIRNGTVKAFGLTGISQTYTLARDFVVVNVHVIGNGTLGLLNNDGINIASSNARIEGCTAGGNDGDGIHAGASARLINNTVFENSGAFAIFGSFGSILSGNTAYLNTTTTTIRGEAGARIIGNTAYNNTGTYVIYGGHGSIISGNTVHINNVSTSIHGLIGASIEGNTAYQNSGLYTISGNIGTTIRNNTAYNNAGWGIYSASASLVMNNTLYSNNMDNNADTGGLYISYDCRVVGNTLDDNRQNNIYVASGDNVLMENHVTDSLNGIFFIGSGNYYRDNTAAGNVTAFVNSHLQTDGGGNVAF